MSGDFAIALFMRKAERTNFINRFKLSYDPDDVNIRLQHFRISELVNMIDEKLLDILGDDYEFLDDPEELKHRQKRLFDRFIDDDGADDLQRNTGLWNITQKSQFIESLMIKLPIPLFYLDGSNKTWRVIDGLQRLNTIVSFISGNFALKNLEYLSNECDGLRFDDYNFPVYLKNRILSAEVIAYVINPGTPPDVKYNIFKRINTGGLKLNGQEIRNAFFRGIPAEFVKTLASDPIFKEATNYKIPSKRMIDREYVNRFLAFQIFDFSEYSGKMDLFLSETMLQIYDMSDQQLLELREVFFKSMARAHFIFGRTAFYRIKADDTTGRQPNKALFDTLAWNLSRLEELEFQTINHYRDLFKNSYLALIKGEQMSKLINDTTGHRSSVTERFNLLHSFIQDFLNDHPN